MNEVVTEKTFGEFDPTVEYYHRVGAYLVIVRDGMVAAIEHRLGYLLPGGGIEGDETHEECLLRECLEEIGYDGFLTIERETGSDPSADIAKAAAYARENFDL